MIQIKIKDLAYNLKRHIKTQLDLRTFDWFFILLLIVICTISYYVVSSAAPDKVNSRLMQIIIGFVAMLATSLVSVNLIRRFAIVGYVFIIILLLATDLFGEIKNGSQRWINLGIAHIQFSEFAKLIIPLFVASIAVNKSMPLSFTNSVGITILILIPTYLVWKQPDLGTSILVASSGLIIIFLVMRFTWGIILGLGGFAAIMAYVSWNYIIKDYQKVRILSVLNSESDPLGSGYHVIQSKIAIGSGGLEGKGLHLGTQVQYNFLPEKHTDFIFAVIGEELGFYRVLAIFALYFLIISRMAWITYITRDLFMKLISFSFTFIFFIYMFVNIGMVIGILPVVGVPLPLISYGGSSHMVLMISFGIMLSIYRKSKS